MRVTSIFELNLHLIILSTGSGLNRRRQPSASEAVVGHV